VSVGAAAPPHPAAVSPPASVAIAIGVGTTAGAVVRVVKTADRSGDEGGLRPRPMRTQAATRASAKVPLRSPRAIYREHFAVCSVRPIPSAARGGFGALVSSQRTVTASTTPTPLKSHSVSESLVRHASAT